MNRKKIRMNKPIFDWLKTKFKQFFDRTYSNQKSGINFFAKIYIWWSVKSVVQKWGHNIWDGYTFITVFEIAGIVIGYVIVGGSKLYQMTCNKEHSKQIANISTRLTKQLDRYTESQNKLFQVTFCLLDSEFYVIGWI